MDETNKMTEKRKRLQGKLRRKFGYSTNTNYGRGVILVKQNAAIINYISEDGVEFRIIRDFVVVMDKQIKEDRFPIYLYIQEYRDNGEDKPENERFEEIDTYFVPLSLEEVNIINDIANEMSEENNWSDQILRRSEAIKNKDKGDETNK